MKKYLLTILLFLTPSLAVAQVQGIPLNTPKPIPAFTLTSSESVPFTHNDLQNTWTLILFGFNSCPDVCPFTLKNLEEAISETSLRVHPDNVPRMVFVSVDPDRDRDGVSQYAAYFHPDFLGVTGDRENIDKLIDATDSFYRFMQPDADGYYEVQHSAFVSVIGPDGQMHARLEPPFHAGKTAEFLARLQIQFRRKNHQ